MKGVTGQRPGAGDYQRLPNLSHRAIRSGALTSHQVSESLYNMPLRCLGPDGQSIQSFDLPEAEWSALGLENRRLRQLRMPCCDASVVMKISTRGLKFFAHKSRGPCHSAPETEAHLTLKTLAAQAAQRAGWKCSTEASGSSPSGETWTADVLAYKGEAKVAIEIQWSPQTNEESQYRQERYRQSRVRCLWLFRRSGFPASKDFPAARVSGDLTNGFKVHLGKQEMPVDEFLDAAFAKRFHYGIPVGAKAIVRVHARRLFFTRKVTRDIGYIDVCVGPHRIQLTVPNLENFPDLLASCKERIPKALSIGLNKPRDKLHIEEDTLAEFQITICERWVKAIEAIHPPTSTVGVLSRLNDSNSGDWAPRARGGSAPPSDQLREVALRSYGSQLL